MIQMTSAKFTDGVLRPDVPLQLLPNARVRLVVESLDTDNRTPLERWAALELLWAKNTIDSGGDILTREQLHELHQSL